MAQNQNLAIFGQSVSQNTAGNTTFLLTALVIGNNNSTDLKLDNTGLTFGSVTISNTNVTVGSISLNSSGFSGVANNASYLGGVAAASYVNTAGSYTITGVHTHNANVVIGTSAGLSANGSYGTSGQVLVSNGSTVYWGTGTSGSNTQVQFNDSGVANASAGFVFDKVGNNLTVSNSIFATTVNAATFSVGSSWTANSTKVVIGAGVGLQANGGLGTAGQSLVSNGSSVYWTTAGATLNANNSDGTIYYIGLSSGTSGSWTNAVVSTTGLSFVPSTGTLTVGNTVIATNFTGTANVATYHGNSSATIANVASWITTNAAAAYTNAVSYTDTKIGTANTAITGNAATAYTNATVFAANATNINTGTLAEARLPYRMDQNVRTTDNITFGNMTITGNLTIGSNVNIISSNNLSIGDNMIYMNSNSTYSNPDIGIAANYNDGTYHHTGIFRDHNDGYWKVFDNYGPEPDANIYIQTTNTTFHLANFMANGYLAGNTSTNWAVVNTSGIYTTGTINSASHTVGTSLIANTTGVYHTGTINAASVTVGSVVIANSTTFKVAGTVDIASSNVKNQSLTDGATVSWDTSSGQVATVTLGGNRTMAAPSNLKVGTYILHVVQDATGSRTLTWNSVFKWPAGVAPVLTTTANARDVFSFISDGTNLYGSYLTDVK
jgi:hypothetical protein